MQDWQDSCKNHLTRRNPRNFAIQIHTGDVQGTRFFIPFHDLVGIPRRTLINEALAARSDGRLREIEEEDHALHRERASDLATKGPVIIAMTPLVAILGWLIGADEAVELYPELR